MRVKCNLCGRSVTETFHVKWNHLLKYHPAEMFSRLLPMVFDIGSVRSAGEQIGKEMKDRVATSFRGQA